jgi:hypothetical protein
MMEEEADEEWSFVRASVFYYKKKEKVFSFRKKKSFFSGKKALFFKGGARGPIRPPGPQRRCGSQNGAPFFGPWINTIHPAPFSVSA